MGKDENVKWLLSEKIILAHILIYCVKEYKGMKPQEVAELIEGEPNVSEAMVNPGESNVSEITGDNTEDAVPNEGKITYDIKFRTWAPDKSELIKLIVDIEAQKDYYPGYDILTRGVFYGARMLSSQMGSEFTGDDYDKIKKVYSIWICMNVPKYAENTITEYSLQKKDIIGEFPSDRGRYDLMSIIMVRLSKTIAEAGESTKLHRLLGALLSSRMTGQEKKDIIESEYNIPMQENVGRRVNIMCNLSDLIEEQGIEQGIERGIKELVQTVKELTGSKDMTVNSIVKRYELTEEMAREKVELYW